MTSLRKSFMPPGPFGAQPDSEPELDSTQLPTPNSEALEGSLESSSSDLSFLPTEAQCRAKARFWTNWNSVDAFPTVADIKKVTNSSSIERWMKHPNFLSWFLNVNHLEERVYYLSDLALRAVEDVLLQTDPKSQGARISAVKQVFEIRKMIETSRASKDTDASKKVENMNKEELLELLRGSGLQITQQINLPAEEPKK